MDGGDSGVVAEVGGVCLVGGFEAGGAVCTLPTPSGVGTRGTCSGGEVEIGPDLGGVVLADGV